jgi:hypothetical protein
MSEKEKKEFHWNVPLKMMQRVPLVPRPQTVYCQPEADENGLVEPKHPIQAEQVYVFTDEHGQKQGAVILCPVHNNPISVAVDHSSRSSVTA